MAEQETPPEKVAKDYRVNFFRPRPGFMRQKVTYIWILLFSWAFFTFGFQFLLVLAGRGEDGSGLLTDFTLFGFPFHYWFSGQFLVVWFILICLLFNLFVDHLTRKHHKPR